MMQQTLYQNCLHVQPPQLCVQRPAPARPRPRQQTIRVKAAADLGAVDSDTSCPFLGAKASFSSEQPGQTAAQLSPEILSLHGPNNIWRVLPNGHTPQLPEPEGRWCWNPLLGEYGEMESKGMGPFLIERYNEFGPVFSWKIGGQKVVAVLDYDAIKSLLKVGDSKVVVAWNPEAMYAMLGEGTRRNLEQPALRIINRKHLAPGFSREAFRGYIKKLVDICRTQLDLWSAAGAPIDIAAEGKNLSFEFSTQLLVDFQIPPERKSELKAKFNKLFTGMMAPPIRLPGTRFSQGLAARAQLVEDIQALVQSRPEKSAGGRKSVLDFHLDAKREQHQRQLNALELAESGIGLIIAGNDTSGLGVTALLAVLPLFPEVLQKMRAEQQQLVDAHGPELTVGLLDDMHYTEAVIKEVLRVAPPSGTVLRRTLADMEVCGKFIPAGSILHLSTLLGQVLTDPRLDLTLMSESELASLYGNWAAINYKTLSADFNPDRWLQPLQPLPTDVAGFEPGTSHSEAEAAAGLKNPDGSSSSAACPVSSSSSSSDSSPARPSGLLTFSVGPHACLGYSLFMTEAKALLALLARAYDVESVDPDALKFQANFVTILKQGTLKFRAREQPLPCTASDYVPHSSNTEAAAAAADAAADAASVQMQQPAKAQ